MSEPFGATVPVRVADAASTADGAPVWAPGGWCAIADGAASASPRQATAAVSTAGELAT